MRRRLRTGRALTIALVAACIGAAPPASAAPQQWQDPAGDSATGALDITSVSFANTTNDLVFEIHVAGDPAVDERLELFIDVDHNRATGDPNGADLLMVANADPNLYDDFDFRWDGSSFVPDSASASLEMSDGLIKVSLALQELGNPAAVDFWVGSIRGNSPPNAFLDRAPDGSGAYTGTRSTPRLAHVDGIFDPSSAPRGLHVGERFAVRFATAALDDGELESASSFTCSAHIGATPLGRPGACAWRVPRTARGKKIVVSVTVAYNGETASIAYRLRVLRR